MRTGAKVRVYFITPMSVEGMGVHVIEGVVGTTISAYDLLGARCLRFHKWHGGEMLVPLTNIAGVQEILEETK